jgi:hypothetical protein
MPEEQSAKLSSKPVLCIDPSAWESLAREIDYPYALKGLALRFYEGEFDNLAILRILKSGVLEFTFKKKIYSIQEKITEAQFLKKIESLLEKFSDGKEFIVDISKGEFVFDLTNNHSLSYFKLVPNFLSYTSESYLCYDTKGQKLYRLKLASNNLPALAVFQNYSQKLLNPVKANKFGSKVVFFMVYNDFVLQGNTPSTSWFDDHVLPGRDSSAIPENCLQGLKDCMESLAVSNNDDLDRKDSGNSKKDKGKRTLPLLPPPEHGEEIFISKIIETGKVPNYRGEMEVTLDIPLEIDDIKISRALIKKGKLHVFVPSKFFDDQERPRKLRDMLGFQANLRVR